MSDTVGNKPIVSSEIVNTKYIFVVYAALIFLMGMLIRFDLHKSLLVATAQTTLLDGIFVIVLYSINLLFDGYEIKVSIAATLSILLFSMALGVFFAIFIIPFVLQPLLKLLFPPGTIMTYAWATVSVYYAMIAIIWSVTLLWTMNIRASIKNEITAINARNDAEQLAILSELRRLRQQLDPHFIFNSLNAIITEVYDDPRQAAALLRELSAYLRYTLSIGDQEFAPIAAEAGAIRAYLRVQDMRFGSKLASRIDVAPEAQNRIIPTLLLQPLIENALKFGVADASGVLQIAVHITAQDDTVNISVENSGVLLQSPRGGNGTGVGLRNLRSRLAMHYGARASFELKQLDRMVAATVELSGEPA
ncbi:sensor histidine kinase [Bradyrhizobium sp. 2TAF24]|uniref:sensor histidine kinase n=1 Tax=Bradyrhizobium sp. 2TAF24 TaxID=3233011 RepID=UPI003F9021DF